MRIWFNHWFSTAYNLVKQLKEADSTITIICSSHKEFMPYKLLADEWYNEPQKDENYANWCLNFCKEHNIDVFIPRTGRVEITKSYKEFEKIGVKVMIDDNFSLMETLDDKVKTMELCKKHNICNIPEVCVVTNIKEFKEKYNYLKSKYHDNNICMKYVKDEGGVSFRVIREGFYDIDSLKNYQGSLITYDKAIEILKSVKSFKPLILMVYMTGVEVSIDSLMTSKGFIGCARYKESSKITKINIDSPLIEVSKKFAEITGIKRPYNMQFMYHNDTAYLLEVNTRMAGGTYKSGLAGINFPYLAYLDLVGLDFKLPVNVKNITLTTMETPLLVSEN